ncbi:hypothetical protein EDD11_002204 [Mortierella claussenii]|nr:hypothetical protein EDD11_002204 [Mortierella claussenii]
MVSSTPIAPATYRYYSLQAVAAQAYATFRRRLFSVLLSSSSFGPGHAPYPGDSQISIPWIKKTLIAANGIPETAKILSVECTGLDGNRGLAGVMNRVLVTFTTSTAQDSSPQQQQLHLILKKTRDGRRSRLGNIVSGQGREAIFYSSDLAKELAPESLLPKVYYAHASSWLGEYVILMEDVKQRQEHKSNNKDSATTKPPVDVNFIFGNQIWGIPLSVDKAAFPSATTMLEQMFITAAEIHAQHWNDSRLLNLSWLKSAGWYQGSHRTQWEWSVQAGAVAWKRGKAKVAGGDYAVKYSEKFVKIMDESFERASWETLQQRLQNKSVPFTLTHGDFHAANMILDRTKSSAFPDIVLYDWSEICIWEPTTDLGQTVISDVAAPVFQAHARIALRKYWERLIELKAIKAADYSFETCWKSFLRGGIEKWLWTFAILCSYPGMPAAGVQYFHDQLLAFIEMAEQEGDISYEITTVLWFLPPTAAWTGSS